MYPQNDVVYIAGVGLYYFYVYRILWISMTTITYSQQLPEQLF